MFKTVFNSVAVPNVHSGRAANAARAYHYGEERRIDSPIYSDEGNEVMNPIMTPLGFTEPIRKGGYLQTMYSSLGSLEKRYPRRKVAVLQSSKDIAVAAKTPATQFVFIGGMGLLLLFLLIYINK